MTSEDKLKTQVKELKTSLREVLNQMYDIPELTPTDMGYCMAIYKRYEKLEKEGFNELIKKRDNNKRRNAIDLGVIKNGI